jgi:g-D-glutamyl-meso-diaminopimelate peptidase
MKRPLSVFIIGKGPVSVFYNGAHHANEWITCPVLMRFLEEYARAVEADGLLGDFRARELYEQTTLHILPMVNPDGVDLVTGALTEGAYYKRALKIAGAYPDIPFPSGWKANIEGIDLNLQYPAGWTLARLIKAEKGVVTCAPRDYVGPEPLAAPESRAVYDYTIKGDFALTLSYHTQGKVIYWKYLDFEPKNSFQTAMIFRSVSGYDVEVTPAPSGFAGYKDWFISAFDRPGYTIEAGEGVSPLPVEQFDEIYQDNYGILAQGLKNSMS